MSRWAYARRGDETMHSWALRLLRDPLLGLEPIATIAEMSGCPRDVLEDAQRWLDQSDPVRETVRRLREQYGLDGSEADVVRDALAAYELELTHSGNQDCPMCGRKPVAPRRRTR